MASPHDETLFGDLNTRICDKLSEYVEINLKRTISALPMINEERQRKLEDILTRQYYKNIDILEIYNSRNIFSVQKYPSLRQKKIVDLFMNANEEDLQQDIQKAQQTIEECQPKEAEVVQPNQIPSQDDIQTVIQDTQQLVDRLKQIKKRKAKALCKLKELEVAQQLAGLAELSPNIPAAITETVQEGQKLQSLQQQGSQLLEKLQQEKRQRPTNNQDENAVNPQPAKLQKASMSIQERYQFDKKTLGGTSIQSIRKLQNILNSSK